MADKKLNLFKKTDLTEGSIVKGIMTFAIPLFFGQLLQQLYNLADAWVIGNFADNAAFAAVSSAGNLIFLVTGFCNGLAIGGGVVISKYFGAKDEAKTKLAVHTNVLMGIISSVIATVLGVLLIPAILRLMKVPDEVMESSLMYFRVYFAGVATVIMYNIFMAILRALGDSIRPLYYLLISSVINVVLDLLFVAVFRMGVFGAAIATVFSQGVSAVLCLIQMMRSDDASHLDLKALKYSKTMMHEVMVQGLPSGIQNSVISIGNIVIQTNINMFGEFAMSGHGAYAKIEGFAFLPIMCMANALPTFISQNIGAGKRDRAKRGSVFGIGFGVILAEVIGALMFFYGRSMLQIFVQDENAIFYGMRHMTISPLFFFALGFSHVTAGALRGYGKSVIPMAGMLTVWCAFRIVYVTIAVHIFKVYDAICWAYPITWSITTVIFFYFIVKEMKRVR